MLFRRKYKIDDHGVSHLNRQWSLANFPPILATILNFSVPAIVLGGFALSLVLVTLFALIYWTIDQGCFVASNVTYGHTFGNADTTFQMMFALSAQTFTTVGYGGIYVRCVGTNVLVALEWYISLLIGAIITGILIVNLLSPPPMVRWSKQVLLTKWRKRDQMDDSVKNDEEEALSEGSEILNEIKKCLTFRVVSESPYQLTSFKIEATAYILRVDDSMKNPVGTFIEPLQLLHSDNVVFHQFGAAHLIDKTSPLYPLLSKGKWDLLQKVVCTATYHDPRYKSDCVSYHTYWNSDFEREAIFETMVMPGKEGDLHQRWRSRTYDHSMIDEIRSQEELPLHKMSYHPLPDGMA